MIKGFLDNPLLVGASELGELSLVPIKSNAPDAISYPLAALSAGRFICEVRGLPITEANIEILEKIYCVKIHLVSKTVGIKLNKCKQLLSNQIVEVENTKLIVSDYLCDGKRIRLYKCDDIDLFSTPCQRVFLYRDGLPLCDAFAAYSYNDGVVDFKFIQRDSQPSVNALEAALAIATELSESHLCGRITYRCEMGEGVIVADYSSLTLFSSEKAEKIIKNVPPR